jgi:hypothetical protein
LGTFFFPDHNHYSSQHIHTFFGELLAILKALKVESSTKQAQKAINGCFFVRIWLKYIAERGTLEQAQHHLNHIQGIKKKANRG